MLQVLSVRCRADKLLIRFSLLLPTSFTQFTLSVDLMVQVHFNEVLLLLLRFQHVLDLNESFFRSKVRLIVECLHSLLSLFSLLLLDDLVAEELTVSRILILSILCLYVLHAIHVVHGIVELHLLIFSDALNTLGVLCKAI